MKIKIVFLFFTIFLIAEIFYLNNNKPSKKEIEIKNRFVKIVKLTDLSIDTEAKFVRFRSSSDLFSIFNESPMLIDYTLASFTYSINPKNVSIFKCSNLQ